jgi:ATP-dependent DNA helicase RecG
MARRLDERVARFAAWSQPVEDVRYARRHSEALARLGIATIGDLLMHYPFRYLDLTATAPILQVLPGDATVVGDVERITVKKPRPRLTVTEVLIHDGTAALAGVWFNQKWIADRFSVGERVAFSGRVEMDYGLKQIKNPFWERVSSEDGPGASGRIIPVHRTTEGLSTNWVRRLVAEALVAFGDVPDPLPAALRARRGLTPLSFTLRAVHEPATMRDAERARHRLAYEELFLVQLGLALRRHAVVDERPGVAHVTDGPALRALRAALPFELTGDQRRSTDEILADMAAPRPMNRLLLGDVGTGKTAVAVLALAAVADTGGQAAMMAPTEVLARQYAAAVGPLLDKVGVRWELLTGSTPASRRREILRGIGDGSTQVAFGTHALVQEGVDFRDLTLAIVDEQHRFGVNQRLALRSKGAVADLLVMTATPIPRSLALTLYGDLDTSTLRERPGGRRLEDHVTTEALHYTKRAVAYHAVREAVGRGERAFVVCALVEESEAAEARAAKREAERLAREVFPELRIGLLTGRMKAAEKAAVMDRFREGDLDVLVATTVIEVGIDVPEATVMVVEDAERFGLAQLHQLRGRVGRGEAPGRVMLLHNAHTDEARERIDAIVRTTDGFALAEEDLRQRGEGQVLGERQSGVPELRIASLVRDIELLEVARRDATELVASDPRLERAQDRPLREELLRRFDRDWIWVSSG